MPSRKGRAVLAEVRSKRGILKTRSQQSAMSSGEPLDRKSASAPSVIESAMLVGGRITGRPDARNSGSFEGRR